ncbi:hypothetical protein L5515_008479 [Caenorhabditis briggsae]|uniref:7TM GPCR serpentine receptor class x (Srx) domain-containing protein n=1 Tax=Caenorhabditis briggsae TaxID=6238 RepID=A0AAE9JMH1_CAEBR|nr:hypothetical protein L5515_008479 [Caenorhabditis briggsae]
MQRKMIVALITFLVTVFGTVSNALVFLAARRMSSMNSSFGIITKNQAIFLTLITNLLTAFKAGRNSRMLVTAAIIKKSKQQKQRELNFIKQSFLQGLSVFSGQVTYYLIAPILSNPVLIFCFGTMYAFMHSIEGAIILASNQEMRSALKPRKGKSRFEER